MFSGVFFVSALVFLNNIFKWTSAHQISMKITEGKGRRKENCCQQSKQYYCFHRACVPFKRGLLSHAATPVLWECRRDGWKLGPRCRRQSPADLCRWLLNLINFFHLYYADLSLIINTVHPASAERTPVGCLFYLVWCSHWQANKSKGSALK